MSKGREKKNSRRSVVLLLVIAILAGVGIYVSALYHNSRDNPAESQTHTRSVEEEPGTILTPEEHVDAFLKELNVAYNNLRLLDSKTDDMNTLTYLTDTGKKIIVGKDVPIIYSYARSGQHHMIKPLRDESDALDRAQAVFGYFGRDVQQDSKAHITKLILAVVDGKQLAAWRIFKAFKCNDEPCRGAYLQAFLNVDTGEIEGISYQPVVSPTPSGANEISKENAHEIFRQWLPGTTPSGVYALTLRDDIAAQRVLAFPAKLGYAFDEEVSMLRRGPVFFDKSYYCWEFAVEVAAIDPSQKGLEDNFQEWYWVDRYSGEIIGGARAKEAPE